MPKKKPRADGLHEKKVQIGYNPDGSPNRVSVYGHTQRELNEKVDELKQRKAQGLPLKPSKITLGKWADTWFEAYANGGYKHKNITLHCITKIKEHSIGGTPIDEITPIDVSIFYKSIKHYIDLSRRIKIIINNLFETAIDNNLILRNPARNIKLEKAPKRKVKALTDPEEQSLLNCRLSIKQLCYCGFALYAGLRPGETRAFTVLEAQKMLKDDTINVWKTVSIDESGKEYIKETPKTDAGNRIIPLRPELKTILKEYLSSIEKNNSIYLFSTKYGELISESSHKRIVESIRKKFNKVHFEEKDITYYQLRHTFITRLWYEKVDLKDAQYLAGHADIKLTLEVYVDAQNEYEIHSKLMQRWGGYKKEDHSENVVKMS